MFNFAGLRMLKLLNWLRIPAIVKRLTAVWWMIGFTGLNGLGIGAALDAFVNFRTASSAIQVHKHVPRKFFSRSEMGIIAFATLWTNSP